MEGDRRHLCTGLLPTRSGSSSSSCRSSSNDERSISRLCLVAASSRRRRRANEKTGQKGQGQKSTLYVSPTNTNKWIRTVGNIVRDTEACFNLQVQCCQKVAEAYSSGCFCNPSMQALFGDQMIADIENTLLPQCRAVIDSPVEDAKEDCDNPITPKYQIGTTNRYRYGCEMEDMALEAARLITLEQLGAVFTQEGSESDQCFDFENVLRYFVNVWEEETPASAPIVLPYGVGDNPGMDQMIEYVGIVWSALKRHFWINGPVRDLGGQFSSKRNGVR
jgi:hypothetical protein